MLKYSTRTCKIHKYNILAKVLLLLLFFIKEERERKEKGKKETKKGETETERYNSISRISPPRNLFPWLPHTLCSSPADGTKEDSNPTIVPAHYHQSLNREGRWSTIDDFATSFFFFHSSPFSTALCDVANSRPFHSLMLSSNLFLSDKFIPP